MASPNKHQRSAPFWTHKSLIPLKDDIDEVRDESTEAVGLGSEAAEAWDNDLDLDDHDLDDGLVDTQIRLETCATFRECLNEHIRLLREFADGLEYQRQFTDHRMLETLEQDGAGLFRLAKFVSATKAALIHLDHLLQLPGKGPHQTLCITALVLKLAKKIHDFTYLYYWRIHTSAYS